MTLETFPPGAAGCLRPVRLNQAVKARTFNIWEFNQYLEQFWACLSETERKQVNQIKLREMQNRFVLRKGITRLVLGCYFKIPPAGIRYTYNEYGKPFLEQAGSGNHFFNLSHSQEYLLIAISHQRSVGVDIEKVNQHFNYHRISESVFSQAELADFLRLDSERQIRSFYQTWVQKEAISKALGIGLSVGFNTFAVNIDPAPGLQKYVIVDQGVSVTIAVTVAYNAQYCQAIAVI